MKYIWCHFTEPPVGVDLLKRTDKSLLIQITVANQTEMRSNFTSVVEVESTKKEIQSISQNVLIVGLKPFTNETLNVKVCNNEGSCSPSINVTFQTNVGGTIDRHIQVNNNNCHFPLRAPSQNQSEQRKHNICTRSYAPSYSTENILSETGIARRSQ